MLNAIFPQILHKQGPDWELFERVSDKVGPAQNKWSGRVQQETPIYEASLLVRICGFFSFL